MANKKENEKEEAWIGDAALALFARKWILENKKKMDAKMFSRLTSNCFLNSIGNPTKVEAKIGRIFNQEGLKKASKYIEEEILPLFLKQEKKRIRQAGRKR